LNFLATYAKITRKYHSEAAQSVIGIGSINQGSYKLSC